MLDALSHEDAANKVSSTRRIQIANASPVPIEKREIVADEIKHGASVDIFAQNTNSMRENSLRFSAPPLPGHGADRAADAWMLGCLES